MDGDLPQMEEIVPGVQMQTVTGKAVPGLRIVEAGLHRRHQRDLSKAKVVGMDGDQALQLLMTMKCW